jgi:hypothetical protein
MATIYERAGDDDDVNLMIKQVLKDWHPEVFGCKPTFDVLFAENDKGIDVMLHGYPCAAKIKQNSYVDRVAGKADVQLIISQSWWGEHTTDDERLALLDHELTHLEYTGKEDDLGRPKFAMRTHDVQLGVFTSVMRRHKKAAVDTQNAINFITGKDGQMLLSWIAEPEKLADAE